MLRYWLLHRTPLRWLSQKINRHQFMVIAGLLIGLTAGLAAVLLKVAVHFLNRLITYDYPIPANIKEYFYLIFPFLAIVLTVVIVHFFFRGKDGKGIANILYAITKKSSVVPRKKMYSQLVTSAVTVGFGGSSGLEGPIAITGAAIGSNFGKAYHLTYRDRTLLLAAGAAGGIAAVFNAPITGVMFAVEVLLAGVAIIEFIPLILASVAGTLFSQIILNENILFSFKQRQAFDYSNVPAYIILGIICGIMSLYYSSIVLAIERIFHKLKRGVFIKAIIGGTLLAVLCFVFPPLFGEGYESVRNLAADQPLASFRDSFWLSYLGREEWLILVLIAVLALVKAVATSVTIFGGGAGGNFAPSLFVGAHTGYFFSTVINKLGWIRLPVSNFTLIGMCGILSGVLYAPITAIFLIAEVTGGYDLMIPLMIVSSISYFFCRQVEPYSMETRRMAKKGDIFTEDKDSNVLNMIKMEPWIEKDVLAVSDEAKLGDMIALVKKSKRNIFAVLDQHDMLVGVLLLEDIREIMFDREQYDHIFVRELMKLPPAVIEKDEDMKSVMKKFDETSTWNLPVVQKGKYLGFISKSTILNSYRSELVKQS